jgi:hypothetical protein
MITITEDQLAQVIRDSELTAIDPGVLYRKLAALPRDPEPRPARDALLAFTADVLACAPDDAADPSSLDTEALAGLAFSAGQLLGGEPTVYDQDSNQNAAQLAGAKVLLAQIKQVEEPDGSWPGGDVVDVLTEWFTGLGLDIESLEGTRWADEWADEGGSAAQDSPGT